MNSLGQPLEDTNFTILEISSLFHIQSKQLKLKNQLIQAFRSVILYFNTGLILLACPTWGLPQKCLVSVTVTLLVSKLVYPGIEPGPPGCELLKILTNAQVNFGLVFHQNSSTLIISTNIRLNYHSVVPLQTNFRFSSKFNTVEDRPFQHPLGN